MVSKTGACETFLTGITGAGANSVYDANNFISFAMPPRMFGSLMNFGKNPECSVL